MLYSHILAHPYYHTGSVLAKQATNMASIVWALVVLTNDNALAATAYHWLTHCVHENAIAGVMLIVSLVQMVWLMLRLKPMPYGLMGYAFQAAWWIAAATLVLLNRPIQPTATMGAVTVAILAGFAFCSGTRLPADDADTD